MNARSEVLVAMLMVLVFLDVKTCRLVECSASIFRVNQSKKIAVESLLDLLIPAAEGTTLFRNDSNYLVVDTAACARRRES